MGSYCVPINAITLHSTTTFCADMHAATVIRCGNLRLGSGSLRSSKVPIQGIPHRARGHLPLAHIP